MYLELPVLTRCCLCLPLRCGLIVWGYFKMITDTFCVIASYFTAMHFLELLQSPRNMHTEEKVLMSLIVIAIIILLGSLVLTTLFIIGCHQKNVSLMKGFYFYGYFMLALFTLATAIYFGWTIYMVYNLPYYFWLNIVWGNGVFFLSVVIQLYIQLLIRSEIIKLNNTYQFRFVNNAAMAECTLNIEYMYGENNKIIEAECPANRDTEPITTKRED